MQRILHSVTALLLAVVLFFGTTPKEYIHLFADHVDTSHHHCEHGDEPAYEVEHHHCEFLSFTLSPFEHSTFELTFKKVKPFVAISKATEVVHLIPRFVPASRLRGPPAIV